MPACRPVLFALRALRLRTRLALGFGLLLVLMMAVVVLAVGQFRELARQGEQVMRVDLERLLNVQSIHQHAQGHGNAMARLLTAPRAEREAIYPAVDEEYAAVNRLLEAFARKETDGRILQRLAEVERARVTYRDAFTEVVEAIEEGEPLKARDLFSGKGQQALGTLVESAKSWLMNEQAAMALRQESTQAQIRHAELQLAGLAGLAVVLAALMAWRITASVARPLARVEAAANRMATGDYATRVEDTGTDELGRVATAMNGLAQAVAAREAEIESLAFTDHLTGLANRPLLRRQAKQSPPGAVLLMDVARMRVINEVLGFEVGDALLKQVGQRLTGLQTTEVQLARLPGAVFALVCKQAGRAWLEQLREQVDALLHEPLSCGGQSVDVSLVHGLVSAQQFPGLGIDDLLRRGEQAVAQAKQQKQGWAWHVPQDAAARTQQLSLLSSLRDAAHNGQLELWLQPKHHTASGQLCGMEGLVRWRHPERGMVSPAEFIPFAERTGHIGLITQAMLRAALTQLAQWQGRAQQHLTLAVNVSAVDLQNNQFVPNLQALAQALNAPLSQLRLEITESSAMQDAEQVLAVLHALRDAGVSLSIDDFGTGYSSLAYLSRLPVNELKIDRSFVDHADTQPGGAALLRTMIELGHSLGMAITAEGVERAEELALLKALNCDVVQGFLVSKPLAPAAAQAYALAHTQGQPEATAVV